MSVLHTVMAATLALSGTLPGLPSHWKRPANRLPDGSWIIGARERSRLAWRQRVDAAAREIAVARKHGRGLSWEFEVLRAALAAPRPWRSPRKPDPRRRYSRSHRRACKWCRGGMEWLVLARRAESCGLFGLGCFRRDMYRNWRRNPHGRSGR